MEVFMINQEKFEKIINKFISKQGIRAVVTNTDIIKEKVSENFETWKCNINLRGGFSISLELIEDILYKDDEFYCNINSLI